MKKKKKHLNCKHKNLYPNYLAIGRCVTPYCKWEEVHCKDCGMFILICGCHFMDFISGWSYKRCLKFENSKKRINLNNPVKGFILTL